MVSIIIVPQGLIKLIFDAYHDSGVGGHIGINKTVLVLQLRFLWPNMRKTIIKCVKACMNCISMEKLVTVSQQLIQSWPLLTPFAVISMDLWSPGDITSPTGVKHILNCMCDTTTFVVRVAIKHANSSELAQAFMENVFLKFGLCLVVVVDNGTPFMYIFEQATKTLNIRLHRVAKRNHKAVGVEIYHRFLNHAVTLAATTRETISCFVEAAMVAAYAWNAMLIGGTDIPRSVPTIGRPLRFPMDIAIAELPPPIVDAAKATVSYICNISHDARFSKELVTWLTEERREQHRERVNQGKSPIPYHVGDMVMACVQVQSKAAKDTVGKVSVLSRGPDKITEDHGNGSYSVQPFDKPDAAIRKLLGQDLYALPSQILPCNEVDLVDLRYLKYVFAPVDHHLKYAFDIESYNSMWYDKQPPSIRPPLITICKDSLPPAVESLTAAKKVCSTRPDTVDEMDTALKDNEHLDLALDTIVSKDQSIDTPDTSLQILHRRIMESKDNYSLSHITLLTH